MKHILFPVLLLIASSLIIHGQNQTDEDLKPESHFIDFSFNLGGGNFKDQATSPLTYSGPSFGSGIGKLKIDNIKETKFGINYSLGFFISSNEVKSSIVNEIEMKYYQLYNIKLKNEKWNLAVGGELNSFSDIRVNQSLMNNAFGMEHFFTIFASGRISKDISRNTDRIYSVLNYKFKLPARKRTLSYTQNISLYNSVFRNNYIYLNHDFIVNENSILGNYEHKAFSGFRLASQLDYTHYLKNCNAIQVSYKWQAIQTAKEPHRFEFASHKIQLSFLFNTK